jgi:hypothetical protein
MPRRALAGAGAILGLTLVLAACCPRTAPPATAFVATLTPLGNGRARAHLQDGRQLLVTGLSDVPAGTVYLTGSLLPDGTVAAASVRPTATTAPPPPPRR